MKRILIIFAILYAIGSMSVSASEKDSAEGKLTHSRAEILSILQEEDIDIPENAYIGVSEFTNNENKTILVASVIQEDSNHVQQSFLLPLDENDNPVDIGNMRAIAGATSGSISCVYASAYYYSATGSPGSVPIYRPYKVSFTSTASKNIRVKYYTYGVRFNLSYQNQATDGEHIINCNAYPATANQYYDTTYYYNGYLGPGAGSRFSLSHYVSIWVDGDYKGSFDCPDNGSTAW